MRAFSYGKTQIRVYGGYGSIGGNCVVISSPSLNVMLDQGVNFSQLKKFYGFSIQPDSVEELRAMRVLPPREAYSEVEEVYVTHLHLDHLGSLNIPGDIPTYLPSREIAEALSRSWWFGWKQHLLPKTQSFYGFKEVNESKRVLPAMVSHSAYPSYALRVDTDDASILYTGDLRVTPLHTISGVTLENLKRIAEDGVDILIVEGTNFGRRMSHLSPSNFRALLAEILEGYGREVLFISTHPLDLEATLSVLELLWRYGYTPVFENLYYAKLLDIMLNTAVKREICEIYFTPRSSRIAHLDNFEIAFLGELRDRMLAIFTPPYGVKDVKDIIDSLDLTKSGLLHVTVLGEPLSEEWIIEERKVENWLKLLGVTSYRIHVSGHYQPYEFKEILQAVKPRNVIPIHTKATKAILDIFERSK